MKTGFIGHGASAASMALLQAGLLDQVAKQKINTCQMTEEEIKDRDRPVSRQERRQMERLARKGRTA